MFIISQSAIYKTTFVISFLDSDTSLNFVLLFSWWMSLSRYVISYMSVICWWIKPSVNKFEFELTRFFCWLPVVNWLAVWGSPLLLKLSFTFYQLFEIQTLRRNCSPWTNTSVMSKYQDVVILRHQRKTSYVCTYLRLSKHRN